MEPPPSWSFGSCWCPMSRLHMCFLISPWEPCQEPGSHREREAVCSASLGGHGCGTPGTQDPPPEGAGPRLDPDKERPNRKTHKWLQKNALCGVTVQKILKRRLEKLLPQALRYHISTPTENHAWRLRGSRGRPGKLPARVLRILLHLAGAKVQPRS